MKTVLALITLVMGPDTYGDKNFTPEQMYCVARAVYSEARGEGVTGQVAVAWAIRHRVESSDFPDTPCKVVYQTKPNIQFPDVRTRRIDYTGKDWYNAVEAAVFVWAGFVDDPIGGARFFYCPSKVAKPSWTRIEILAQINNHNFYDKVNRGSNAENKKSLRKGIANAKIPNASSTRQAAQREEETKGGIW